MDWGGGISWKRTIREVEEEIGVKVKKEDLIRGYENLSNDVPIIVFTSKTWLDNLRCKEASIKELKWFRFDDVPYELMIKENKYWLPKLLV